jgi:hypothetical protein
MSEIPIKTPSLMQDRCIREGGKADPALKQHLGKTEFLPQGAHEAKHAAAE